MTNAKKSTKRFLFASALVGLLSYFPSILSYYRIFYIVIFIVFCGSLLLIWNGSIEDQKLTRNCRLLVLFFAYLAFTALWAQVPGRTLTGVAIDLIFIPVWALGYLLQLNHDEKEMARLFVWIPYAVAATFIYLLARFGALRPYDEASNEAFGATANACVQWLIVSFPFILWLIRRGEKKRYVELTLTLTLILMAASRTGYFVIGFCVLAEIYLRSGDVRRFFKESAKWAVVLALVIGCSLYLPATRSLVQEGYDRTVTRENVDDDYLDLERLWMLEQGWESFLEHPILGIGYDNLGERIANNYGQEIVSHNLLVTLIAESGWPGFILFVILIRGFFKRTNRARVVGKDGQNGFYAACIVSMTAALLTAMAFPPLQFPLFYVVLGIGYASNEPMTAQLGQRVRNRPLLSPA